MLCWAGRRWLLTSWKMLRGSSCTASFGKGSSCPQTRLSSSRPIVPHNTNWASPSEDDIHVSDVAHDGQVPFSSFPLDQKILDSLHAIGCDKTFEIQGKTLPLTFEGRDVIGRAVTGSGKTLAFALPIVHTLSKSPRTRNPRALVITPTRELCNQVHSMIQRLDHDIRCVALYGGASYIPQEDSLRRGVDVIIATPGRLNDHRERGNFGLDDLKFLVLDEADELLTPNFKRQIEGIIEDSPKEKQVMLFSATMPPDIRAVTDRYMRNAVMVDLVSDRSLVPDAIVHEACRVPGSRKMSIVPELLHTNQPKRAVVFMPMRRLTHQMGERLRQVGFKAGVLNSDMTQHSREAVVQQFRRGRVEVLVATDVAARGLDIPDIELIIHVGVPPNGVEYYIHRSGRTGRKGQPGKTILVYSDRDPQAYGFLEDLRRSDIKLKHIRPPSSAKMAEFLLEKAVSRLNPAAIATEVLERARPHAKELIEKYGEEEAMAAALVSMSKIESSPGIEEDMGEDFGGSGHSRSGDRDMSWRRRGDRWRGDGRWQGRYDRGGGYRSGGGFRGRDRYQDNRRSSWGSNRRQGSFEDDFFKDEGDSWDNQGRKGGRDDPFAWDD